jgi:hypothetical protein
LPSAGWPAGRAVSPGGRTRGVPARSGDRGRDDRYPPRSRRALDTRLLIEIDADGVVEPPDRIELEDRVGAVDGRVTLEQSDGAVRIVAEFPCAS